MRSCRSLLLWLCALLVTRAGEGVKVVCRAEHYLQIQETCREPNEQMLEAVKQDDNKLVCKRLVDVFYCVAGHVPQCFHNLTGMYSSYFHSPHHCVLTDQQIMALQNLTTDTAQKQHPQDDGHVEVEVDIIVPVTTSSPEEKLTSQPGEGEEDEGTVVVVGGGMKQEGQSGRAGAQAVAASMLGLVVMTTACLCTVTASLFS